MKLLWNVVKMIKILLTEDNADLRAEVRDLLLRHFRQTSIVEVNSAEDALKAISLQLPDLIITDIHMPGINGLELTKIIRRRYSDIQIAVLTHHDMPEYKDQALRNGANYFVSKTSGSSEDILAMVQSIIQKNKLH